MAERGVAGPLLDVILLGKTGLGKSTTGNKLIDADGNNAKDQACEGTLKRTWPQDELNSVEHEALPLRFDASDGTDSATKRCAVIFNYATGFRVMDTRGFAPSDVTTNAYLANLRIMREVVRVSTHLKLNYHRVLYFLPVREIPSRADAYLQEELAVLWHFFGSAIFKNMAIVVTVSPRSETKKSTFIDEFGESEKGKLETIFNKALKNAIRYRQEDAPLPPCPSIIFIPPRAPSEAVAKIVRNADTCEPKGISLVFRNTTCCKCASVIYIRRQQDANSIVGVEEDEKIKSPEDSHCHPVLIPKHSKLVRIFGSVVHIAVLGVILAYEHRKKKTVLPSYFGTPDEKCANCGCAPIVKGCMKVGERYNDLRVDHEHEQRALQVVDN